MTVDSGIGLKEDTPSLPAHLARLAAEQWALWRYVELRSAGFPAALILKLSSPKCAAAANRVLQAEKKAQQAGDEALKAVYRELNLLYGSAEWSNRIRRDPLVKARRSLEKGRLPEPLDVACAAAGAVEALHAAQAELDSSRARFQRTFDAERVQISEAIHEVAQVNRFREAVIWQNRGAFHSGIKSLLRKPVVSLRSKKRQKEEMVALYLQRYCVKNDTIGFFGPVGWAKFVSQKGGVTARPGPGLLSARRVYFEQWCIDTLAEVLAKNEALRPWLAPRRIPLIHIEGTTLYRPFKRPTQISPALATVLQACDGNRPAKEIAEELMQTPQIGLHSKEAVYNALEFLRARALILWTLEVPLGTYPERDLRRLLERIEEDDLRGLAVEALNEVEAARSAVSQAAGDAEKLDQALGNLEETFTRLTGVASTRSAGQIYAGRTLVYEDCRRDIKVHLGSEILESLGPPLSLLLASARWLTFETAAIYREVFHETYAALVRTTGSRVVDLTSFWHRVQPLVLDDPDTPPGPVASILSDFQGRWEEILRVPQGSRSLQYTSDELRPWVLSRFDAPGPGWKVARYHSPDVMIAASSVEAIQQGCYHFVLGEIHVGTNTILNSPFCLAQYPSPEELFQALDLDLPESRVVPIVPRKWRGITSRTYNALVSTKDFRLAFTVDAGVIPQAQTLSIGSLVVENGEEGLMVRTRDGRLKVDIIEFFADALSLLVENHFKIRQPCSYTPRITVDRLVLCRETWRFPVVEIPFPGKKSKAEDFLEARRWVYAHNLPRFVFVRTPVEKKPFFVDFDSPILVNILARAIRRTRGGSAEKGWIAVTEMLPTFDQVWLPDIAGQRYTSEFRLVALDRAI